MKSTLKKILFLAALGFGFFNANPARAADIYDETNGVVVVEAEHFYARVNSGDGHHFHLVPDEDGRDELADSPDPATVWTAARGGKYVQALPDSPGGGQNNNQPGNQNGPPSIDYRVMINASGAYRLWLRWGGYDGSSDSIYAQIVEARGVSGNPNWYRYARAVTSRNFDTGGWHGDAAPNDNGAGGSETAAVWNLNPGTYTIRVAQREDGSALDTIALALNGLGTPAGNVAESRVTTSWINITTYPQDAIATPGNTATFTAAGDGSAPLTFQWQRKAPGEADFTNVTGATSATYTTPTATAAMNGTLYRVRISNGTKTVVTTAATLITDATPPAIAGAFAGSDMKSVIIRFSERVLQAAAETATNYTISGLTVSAPRLQSNGTDVVLTTSQQTSGATYNVSVSGIKDLAGNTASALTASVRGASRVTGALDVDIWNNIPNTDVASLLGDARYPNSPDRSLFWANFGPFTAGNNYGDNFGAEISGWIVPPVSGQYKFYLRSDDASQVYLSTNDLRAGEQLIMEQSGCCNVFTDAEGTLSSAPITLQAGQAYWVRALLKEGGGDDYLQMGWRTPNDSNLTIPPSAPIGGQYLRTLADPTAAIAITRQPSNVTAQASSPATFSVAFNAFSAFGTNALVQWQVAPGGSTAFEDIAGATGGTLTIPFALPSRNGAQYRARITASGTTVNSDAATLTVTTETTPPVITSIRATTNSVSVLFSEPVDTASATTVANYSISGGAVVQSAAVSGAAGQAGAVTLGVTGLVAGNTYTLTINGVKDLSNNPIAANSSRLFKVYHLFENFDQGTVPATVGVRGSANVKSSGGFNNTGHGELTTNAGSLQGTIVFPDILNGADVNQFTATFKLYIGNGSGNPADGFAFVLDPALGGGTFGEEGTGSGLIVRFDTYDNGGGEAPAIEVAYGGTTLDSIKVSKASLVNNQWVDVFIQVDQAGRVTVIHNGIRHFNQVQIPDWAPLAGPQVGFGARTGGETARHLIDNVGLIYNTPQPIPQPPAISITSPATGTTLPAGTNATIAVNAQAPAGIAKVEFFANGVKIGESLTAPYSLTIPNISAGILSITATVMDINDMAAVTGPITVTARPAASAPDVLFVHAGAGPNAADITVINRLFSKGFDVQTVGDTPSQTADATGKALVVTSSSVGSGNVNVKFRDVAVPVINWENALEDEYRFTLDDANQRGATANQTQLEIVDPAHPLAAGLSGAVTVVTAANDFTWGVPPASAKTIAKLAGVDRFGIYAFEKGATLVDGTSTAAERRINFFFTDSTANLLTESGWKLWDAAVAWATGAGDRPVLSIARNGAQITISWTGGGTLQSTDSLSAPNWTDVTSTSPHQTTTAGSMKFYRVRK